VCCWWGRRRSRDFIATFGAILRLRNILLSFDDFAGNQILSDRDLQDYQSIYLDLYQSFRRVDAAERESINDDVVFEIELIKQVEINVDYILMLVAKWREARGNGEDRETAAMTDIERSIDSSLALRNKKDLIIDFVHRVSATGEIDIEWANHVQAQRTAELDAIIAGENLKPDETRDFVEHAFRDGSIPTAGTAITKILPPTSRFSPEGSHGLKKARVLTQLGEFFDRFFGLGAVSSNDAQ